MTPKSVRITGWGMYAPERRLTNADLERVVDTSDEWIVSRTGIRERRIAARNETTGFGVEKFGRRMREPVTTTSERFLPLLAARFVDAASID